MYNYKLNCSSVSLLRKSIKNHSLKKSNKQIIYYICSITIKTNLREATHKKNLNGRAIKRGRGERGKTGPLRKEEYLQCFAKNMALLVQKLWGGKKLSKSVFGYYKTKKKRFRLTFVNWRFPIIFFYVKSIGWGWGWEPWVHKN